MKKVNNTDNRKVTEYEKIENILIKAKEEVIQRIGYVEFIDSICKVVSYNNYYVSRLYSYDFGKIYFVFDKDGNLFVDKGEIVPINDNNFFVVDKKEEKKESRAKHYQCVDGKMVNVYELTGVFAVNDGYKYYKLDDNLVRLYECDKYNSIKKHIYDCRTKKIVIGDYYDLHYDLGNFFYHYHININEGLRVIKKVAYFFDDYDNGYINLEFLIDSNGNVNEIGVCDFNHNKRYGLENRGNTQDEMLNSIYYEAFQDYVVSRNRNKRKKLSK